MLKLESLDGPSLNKEEERKFREAQRNFNQNQVEVLLRGKGKEPLPKSTTREPEIKNAGYVESQGIVAATENVADTEMLNLVSQVIEATKGTGDPIDKPTKIEIIGATTHRNAWVEREDINQGAGTSSHAESTQDQPNEDAEAILRNELILRSCTPFTRSRLLRAWGQQAESPELNWEERSCSGWSPRSPPVENDHDEETIIIDSCSQQDSEPKQDSEPDSIQGILDEWEGSSASSEDSSSRIRNEPVIENLKTHVVSHKVLRLYQASNRESHGSEDSWDSERWERETLPANEGSQMEWAFEIPPVWIRRPSTVERENEWDPQDEIPLSVIRERLRTPKACTVMLRHFELIEMEDESTSSENSSDSY